MWFFPSEFEPLLIPDSNHPLLEVKALTTTSNTFVTLAKIQQPVANMKIRVISIIVLVSSTATPEGYINIVSNGKNIVENFPCYIGALWLNFAGKLVFTKKDKNPIEIQVKSDGSTTMYAEAHIIGLYDEPKPKR